MDVIDFPTPAIEAAEWKLTAADFPEEKRALFQWILEANDIELLRRMAAHCLYFARKPEVSC